MKLKKFLKRTWTWTSTCQNFFPDTSFSLDTVRSSFDSAVRADPALADLAAMGAGVSTDGMRVAGVLVGVDAWVKTFVAKKVRSIQPVAQLRIQFIPIYF